jgi:hypothetical protein
MLAAAVLVACAIAGVAITDRSNVTYIVLQVFRSVRRPEESGQDADVSR